MKKRIFSMAMALALAFTMNAGGEMKTMVEETRVEYLSEGIEHMSITRQTIDGPVEIDVLKIDLDDRHTDLKPVYSEEISKRDTLAAIADEWSAAGAVNGDFFNMADPAFTFGTLMDGDDIISSPNSNLYNFPTIVKAGDDFDISIIEPEMTLEVDGEVLPVAAVNKIGAFNGEIIVLNSSWGEESMGSNDTRNLAEIVVNRNRVKSINIGEDPVDIPSSGYVIAFSACNTEILDKFKVGDKVYFDVDFGFDIDDIDWASGGVNYLLREGQEGDYNNDVLGRHPRTAIGFTEDEETAYLITVDGRSEDSIGMLQSELLDFMLELGCWNGVNLDGGGSSEMVVDYYGKGDYEIVNNPSDGDERLLVSGLGAFDSHPRSSTVKSLEVYDAADKLFKGQYLTFDVKGYNKYMVPVAISDSRLDIKISGLDYKKDRHGIRFLESGTAEVKLVYGSVKCTFEVEVLGDVKEIYSAVDSISLNEKSEYELPDFIGVDENGNTATIHASEIDWSLSERIANIDDGIIEARSKSGKAVLEGVFEDGEIYIPLAVGSAERLIEGFENTDNITFVQYPEDSDGRIINHSKSREGGKSVKLYYDFTTMKPDDQSIAFLEFGEKGLLLQDEPDSLSMWVYGDKSDHWLRCRVTDANGVMYKIDFEKEIDWYGWKEVRADLPENISYPVVLNSIYVAEIYNDKADEGYIHVDGLRANYPLGCDDIELPENSRVEDLLMDVPEEYELKLHMGNDEEGNEEFYDIADSNGQPVCDNEDVVVVELSTLHGSISSYDKTQWDALLDLGEYEDRTIVVKTDIDHGSIKSSERKTLVSYMKCLSENNKIFIVSKGTDEEASIRYEDGMRFITYGECFTLYMADGEVSYDYK
ncbi:Predicted protein [Dethiosulfatibacter aminovorans DSM 17477]|uniref:Phosphodiester glycosidase domain-containing protein n=1 Tax=Dethiosulfatibacter aminovorans DSM 17477 TaxID=1121476 RepID=A0A1M6IB34_9FIRM|nr:phosphodiester glycosidase family protein [Dethiosulfatibacter aminovorans]SHJ31645.1 Predicted protein [Dethiosulfatibacter aminovorans DSM 17477]